MANDDLVLQKMLRVTPETHARVMQVIAEIQARTKVNTSADMAVRVLLDHWNRVQVSGNTITIGSTESGNQVWGIALIAEIEKPENETK